VLGARRTWSIEHGGLEFYPFRMGLIVGMTVSHVQNKEANNLNDEDFFLLNNDKKVNSMIRATMLQISITN
jgi:hypothetical protein